MKKLLLAGLVALMVVIGIWGETSLQTYTFRGSVIDPPVAASNFTLTDQNGQPFQLGDQRGEIVLMFFGYTHCPDVCPTTMAQFKQARAQLGNLAGRVRFVFVTVDPERDTPEKIKAYVETFDPAIVGLSGSQADLEAVWRAYGVYRQKQPGSSQDDYADLLEHSASVYLIDAQDNLRLTYPLGLYADDAVQDIRYLLKHE